MTYKPFPYLRTCCVLWIFVCVLATACSETQSPNNEADPKYPEVNDQLSPKELVSAYCGACHLPPDPQNIPKSLWEEKVLPEMAARMGYRMDNYNPFAQYSMEENVYVRQSGIYPNRPALDSITWQKIHNYIITNAPDSIPTDYKRSDRNSGLTQFTPRPVIIDQNVPRVTSIVFDEEASQFVIGSAYGEFSFWSPNGLTKPFRFNSPGIAYTNRDQTAYLTEIGYMNPSQIPKGSIHRVRPEARDTLVKDLHRPVYTEVADLNKDGIDELLICEFGHLTGKFSMLSMINGKYEKQVLLNVPGTIKVEVRDMNQDGLKDILVLASQGNEGLYILYQDSDLTFRSEHVIRLGSEYGTSWFDLFDFDGDGDQDVVIANGDNADYTIFLKPYHGVRIFENDGSNSFEEAWFYPIYGATRVIAEDFDLDSDIDLAVMSFFPGDKELASEGFVFLENQNTPSIAFTAYTFPQSVLGRWLIMESGDYDRDGDEDIMLGSFQFAPPRSQPKFENWPTQPIDGILLENRKID